MIFNDSFYFVFVTIFIWDTDDKLTRRSELSDTKHDILYKVYIKEIYTFTYKMLLLGSQAC